MVKKWLRKISMGIFSGASLPVLESQESPVRHESIDVQPWEHPFHSAKNIRDFRRYSEEVWAYALTYRKRTDERLNCAFSINMAQNMYKWARLAHEYGAEASLYCNPQDLCVISQPGWEDFDGEFHDIMGGAEFLSEQAQLTPTVPCHSIPMGDSGLLQAWNNSRDHGDWNGLHALLGDKHIFPEAVLAYQGCYPYWDCAKAFEKHDVIYTCSISISAYFSGRPYCFFSVGADLQFDCGQAGDYGMVMRLAVNKARFIFASNPHTLGHCRRLGFQNAVYLPYPMDSNRYCPGDGLARHQWEAAYGPGVYILATSRIDGGIKGYGQEFLNALLSVVRERPEAKFVFLGWGNDLEVFRQLVAAERLQQRIIISPPVGKKRLIDFYRSCDVVLDQFVYGYYGTTALEAMSIGKPVVMKMRAEQYEPLYAGDIAPVENAHTPEEMQIALLALIDSPDYRLKKGRAVREWLVRNHGEEKTVPLMLALLKLSADRAPLPLHFVNPLSAPLSKEEVAYHKSCLRPVTVTLMTPPLGSSR